MVKRRGFNLGSITRAAGSLVCIIAAFCSIAPTALASTANWEKSDLDTWFYGNAVGPGTRALAPSFLGGVTVNETTQQFDPSTASGPARAGMALLAFNTSGKITSGLPANQYQINSVTLTATWTYDSDTNALLYDDAPISQSQVLAEALSGNYSRQKPMELYGVGLKPGYTGYEFIGATMGAPLLDEITHPYTGVGGGPIAYPIVGSSSQPSAYVDVENSVTGGYSETEPSQTTAPFTPSPWAIGKTNLTVGDSIPDNTTFTFNLDLNATGVRSYLQQSLADGALGLMISSLHSTGEFGSGGGYPRWYMKESAGFPYNSPPARLPQLLIDYQILPAGVPGDYNGNGIVDVADYVLWRNGGPLQNQVDDPANVTAQDYIEWRSRFGNTAGSGSGLVGGTSVPEPAAILLWFVGAMSIGLTRVGRKRA